MKIIALTSLLTATTLAGDHILRETPFVTTLSVETIFIPTSTTIVQIEPKEWSRFVVKKAIEHGSIVKQGDILITCDREEYDKKLTETKKDVRARKIALEKSKRELSDLELTTPRSLEGQRIAFQEAKESLDYFTRVGRDLEERGAAQMLEAAKMSLAYVEEELKQLLKMYEEDGVTEETEEIILTRQRIALKKAKFGLVRAEQSYKWSMEKTIPRKAIDLQRKHDSAHLKYETAKLTLPLTLEQKRIAVEKAIQGDNEADEKLADMEKDTALFTVTAPTDGMVYYGGIENGFWSGSGAEKFLTEKGSLPSEAPLMTIITPDSSFILQTSVDQEQRLQLAVGNTATVSVAGLTGQEFSAKVNKLALVPNGAGKYPLSLSVELPTDSPVAAGMKGKVTIVTYRNNKALTVPSSAISKQEGISIVKVKQADGKSESREVTIGKSANGITEILSGLTVDQCIITPDAQK
ncbi:MAG: efflux RND transporter periplasmic adaptor subunit [Akkermansiaceae bacterium]